MNCSNCGNVLNENDKFCANCGTPISQESATNQGDFNIQQGVSENVNLGNEPTVQQNFNGNLNYGQPQPVNQGYGQPINQNYGQSVNSNYGNYQNYQNKPQKGGAGKIVPIIAVVLVFLVIGGVVIGMTLMKTSSKSADKKKGKDSKVEKTVDKTEDKTEEVEEEVVLPYKVTFDNFNLEIPGDMLYKDDITSLVVYDKEETWASRLEFEMGNFEAIKADKASLQSAVESVGYIVNKVEDRTIGGAEYITLEVDNAGQCGVMGVTKVNDMYFSVVTAMRVDNELDYTLLEKSASIISSATYIESSTYMKSEVKVKGKTVADAIRKSNKESKKKK